MRIDAPFKKSGKFYTSVVLNVFEGIVAGLNFIVLHGVVQLLFGQNIDFPSLMRLTLFVGIVFGLRLVLYTTGYTLGQISGADVSRNIRLSIGNKLRKIPLGSFTKRQTGFYINAATTEVGNYEKILTHKVGDIVKYCMLIVMVIVFVATMHVPSALVLLCSSGLLVPALGFSIHMVKRYGNRKNRIYTEHVSDMTEYISGIQSLRAYGMGGRKNKRVTESMRDYSSISFRYEAVVIPIAFVYAVLNWLAMPLIIWLAGRSWLSGNLPVFDFVMMAMLPLFICRLNGTLFIEMTGYKNLMISKRHIRRVFEEKEEPRDGNGIEPSNYTVEFDRVFFSYKKDEPVLEGVNFTAESGTITAFVGDSGSGKSTIMNLIAKYYSPDSGEIRIGGNSIETATSEQVLKAVAMVDQEVFLFNDTVRNNIRYARPGASDEEIETACRLSNCDEFIRELELGYDTPIGENGGKLSGGERQRLSVARAILRDSPIILLDETTSSLDIENEILVKKAIMNLLSKDKTVLIIAHVLSTIAHADKILVVDGGRITEAGRHDELLRAGGKYAAMWSAESELSGIQ